MRTSLLYRLPRLAALLLSSCGDDAGEVSDQTSSTDASDTGSSSSAGSTTAESSTSADGTASTADDSGSGGANAAPVANDDVMYGVQDEPLVVGAAAGVLANDVDDDGDGLTIVDADNGTAGGGTVAVEVDGSLSYAPAPGFWGPDAFGYTVSDGQTEASAQVTVYVAPVLIQLASVTDGLGGFAIDGELAGDISGSSVSGAGDVNGDGLADLVVGAVAADTGGVDAGRSYVVFGKADTDTVELSAVAAGTGGFAIDGESTRDYAGRSVSGVGDVNGDGLADIVVGATGVDIGGADAGRSYVVFGKADTETVDLGDIVDGVGGFPLNGETPGHESGWSVSGAGDVDGDGLADLIVGAHADGSGGPPHRSYVVLGKVDTDIVELSAIAAGSGGFAIDGLGSGWSVSGAGDVDGDGLADVILGTPVAVPTGPGSGRSYVVFGKVDTDTVELDAVAAGTGGFAIDGAVGGEESGFSVSGAGDLDGDGLADVLVGARFSDANGPESGRSYVVFGKADTDTVELGSVAGGTGGFAIDGEAANDRAGSWVRGAGDVDGDGIDDVLVGAGFASPNGSFSGRGYVVYGRSDPDAVELGDVAMGIGGFALDGESTYCFAGYGMSEAGDVNGDGFGDIIVGAQGTQPNGLYSGRSYVVFGVPTGPR